MLSQWHQRCAFHRWLFAVMFLIAFTVANSQQLVSVSALAPPSTAIYDYANAQNNFMPVAIASLTGLSDFGSSFSGSDFGWCASSSTTGVASIPLQFQYAVATGFLQNPLWVYQSSTSTAYNRVSSLASGSTLCFYSNKVATFKCKTVQSPNSIVDSAATIPADSFPFSNSSNFALVDLGASDGKITFALTALADTTVPGSLAYTQLLRLEQNTFVPAGGPYIWSDLTPTSIAPSSFYAGSQRLAVGYDGTVFVAAYPSASGGAGLVMIYSVPSRSNLIFTSQITGSANSAFGFSVAVKDTFLAVGAPGSSGNGTVYVFRLYANATVSPICSIVDSVPSSKFGQSLFIETDPLRSPNVFHVLVTAPVMVLRPDQSYKYVTAAAIRVDLSSSSCSIAGSIQWPTIIAGSPSSDTDTLTGVFSSTGQVVIYLKRSDKPNSIIQSVFCLPNYVRAWMIPLNVDRPIYSCQPCSAGTQSPGGISTSCSACPLPDAQSTVVWGFACQFTCPSGSYRPVTCVFDCDVANSRLNNSEWLPLPAPTCTLSCSAGFYNASGTCNPCPALVSKSKFAALNSCSSKCLETFFWSDGSQVVSRINDPPVMCVNCSELNRISRNPPPSNGFWQDNATVCTFMCDLGFFKSDSQCDPCQLKPAQSSWIPGSNCNFICNFGYFGSNCQICSAFKFASGISSPANANWVDGVSTCDWACNSGYNKNVDSSRCCPDNPIQNAIYTPNNRASCNFVCNPGFQWSNSTLSCVACPPISSNSSYVRGCESACKLGYAGNPCITCSEYIVGAVLPPGGVWNMSTCNLSCLTEYRLFSSSMCCPLQLPQNAVVAESPTQCNFNCKEGFRWNSTTLSCSVCPGYVDKATNTTKWGTACRYVCISGTLVPPNSDVFECLTCQECNAKCLPPNAPIPSDASAVVWTYVGGSSGCQWSCPLSKPQRSGTRCCESLPSNAYRFQSAGSCNRVCNPGFDALTDPRTSQFALICVPCSSSYRAPLAPANGYWSDNAPLSGSDNCQVFCKTGFSMYTSAANSTILCCKLPLYAQLTSGAASCNDWVCPVSTYLSNGGCYNTSVMSVTCAKQFSCSQCLSTQGCGWCDSLSACFPGTAQGNSISTSCDKWKFGSCVDDCVGRSCEVCTNSLSDQPDSPVKCSWCSSTSQCIRSETAGQSCKSGQTFSSLDTCITTCSAATDCRSCVSVVGCMYCTAKGTCLGNSQYTLLTDNPRRYNYYCDRVYGLNLPGSCPSPTDNVYLILIVSLGALSCCCFLWFLCSRSNFLRTLCNCCSFRDRDVEQNNWGDQEMGDIHHHNGPGLDPVVLQEFTILKYQKKGEGTISFQEEGVNPACSVCLGEFEVGDNLRILPCMHSFHQSCIDEWFKVGTDCPLCKTDFKRVAQPAAVFREAMQAMRDDDHIQPQNFAARGAPRPRHRRGNIERDDDDVELDEDGPPELPPPLRADRPRNSMRYAVGNVIGNEAAHVGEVPPSPPAFPPPRSRRNPRRPPSVSDDAPAANEVPIHQLVEGGRVIPALSNHPVRSPVANARTGGGAALPPSVVSANGGNGNGAAADAAPLVIGGTGRPARGVRAIQGGSPAAYNASPRQPRDQSTSRMDRLDQA